MVAVSMSVWYSLLVSDEEAMKLIKMEPPRANKKETGK